LRGRYGDGVDQKYLDGLSYRDPVERATGAPEPLTVAMMYASLYFDGTPFGRTNALEFPNEQARLRLPHHADAERLEVGKVRAGKSAYTGTLRTS
jgi:hypothetical protein